MTTTGRHYSYDEVPYPDLCYMQTHPDRLATLGTLLGMTPTPIQNCRVLEIGCATGVNLLAMAVGLPNSTFVGIDYSAVQIEMAQAAANESGVTNITFHSMNMLDITPEFGEFDYIIAHGIYSWIPPEIRDKLLDICQHNLTAQGIAYISYNTYPGWHTLDIMRNMMLYRTHDIDDPVEKSSKAREWISFMNDALADSRDSAYAAIFSNYLYYRPTQKPEFDHAALLHDEMEAINDPVYFYQFAEHAAQHGLQYLVEADFPTVMPNGLKAEVVEYLGETAQTTIEMEQYFDFLRNRTFRRTLLCHESVEVNRSLSINPLRKFYVTTSAKKAEVEPEAAARGIERFETEGDVAFSSDHPVTNTAFRYLIEIAPHSVHFDALFLEFCKRLNIAQPTNADAAALGSNLLQAFSSSLDLIGFHIHAPTFVTEVSEKPVASTFARYQARHGSLIANLRHRRVELDGLTRIVLMNLNGENDRSALLGFLTQLAEAGKIGVQEEDDKPAQTPEDVQRILSRELDTALKFLAQWALLVA